jgi:hypothetical protein
MQAILTAGLHVGRDRSSIVVSLHNDQARAKDHQEGERMLLPVGVDHNASGGRPCGQVELGFFYAHRRCPPDSSFEADDPAETVRGVSASTHTHASGVRISPVGTHSQVIRAALRIERSLLFILSLFLGTGGARATGARACSADLGGSTNHRLGRGESGLKLSAHALNSQVVCCDER